MKNIPLTLQFIMTMIIIIGSIEIGNRIGIALQGKHKNENDGMISVISGSILGVLSFILAFTFGSVYDRFDTRKALVRDEANQIGTVWMRTDLIPEPDRSVCRKLVKEYLNLRIQMKEKDVMKALREGERIHAELWALGVRHVRGEMSSDMGALYFDSVNKLVDIQQLRLSIAYRGHIPNGLWTSLYILLVCAMISIGYYGAIIQSRRSFASLVLAFSFSLVIHIISNLDRLQNNHFEISQQPMLDIQRKIADSK